MIFTRLFLLPRAPCGVWQACLQRGGAFRPYRHRQFCVALTGPTGTRCEARARSAGLRPRLRERRRGQGKLSRKQRQTGASFVTALSGGVPGGAANAPAAPAATLAAVAAPAISAAALAAAPADAVVVAAATELVALRLPAPGPAEAAGLAAAERRQLAPQADVRAELDDDDQVRDADPVGGVQRTYLQVVHDRFKEEAGGARSELSLRSSRTVSGNCARCRRPRSAP